MEVPEIEVDDLVDAHGEDVPLIDVRTPEEYATYHAPSAVLIPLAELVERVDEVPTGGVVYVICANGPRSARAVEYLRSVGVDAVNVAGGSKAWRNAGYSITAGPD